jgi:Contractile injection system tube protein
MATPGRLVKAQLTEITWDENDHVQTVGDPFDVQFNPETLSVTYSNQKSGGNQRGGAALQFVGQGQTKLSVQLWYDVTQPLPGNTGIQQE